MISQIYLRRLVESVLLEGFKDDQRYLVEKYPDHAQDLSRLQPKWIAWLTARFGESPRVEETHPFEDTIVTVLNFSRKDAAIGEKYRSNAQFRTAIDSRFPTDTRSWNSPADPAAMTVDEMETVLGLSERKKERFKTEVSEEETENDRIGKVGPWNLWMPTTRERSCKIAGYDPVTRKPKTTWCTARMAGSNLFYNYVGRPGTDMTLFYVIKDDPKGDQDWLSVGFVDGKPLLDGKHGSTSVDRANDGLTPAKLQKILGSDHDEIVKTLTDKNRSLGGKHPAREKIASAAKSIEAFKYLTVGLSKDEEIDIVKTVLKEPSISPDVLAILAQNPDDDVRRDVAISKSATPEILAALAKDESVEVRQMVAFNQLSAAEALLALADDPEVAIRTSVAYNRSSPPEALTKLSHDENVRVRDRVAVNTSTPPEALLALADDPDDDVRFAVSYNRSTPPEFLSNLAQRGNERIIRGIAMNASSPPEILTTLARHKDETIRGYVAKNPSTTPEVLAILARDPSESVVIGAAVNPAAPPKILAALSRDESVYVRVSVANNRSTPPEVLDQLADNDYTADHVGRNASTSPDTLMKLVKHKSKSTRAGVAFNKNAPIEALKLLLRDRSPNIRKFAADEIAKRQQLNERRLRQLIRRML